MDRRHPARKLRSYLISALKIGLPLLALAMLSTLFMFSRPRVPEPSIPFSRLLDGAQLSGEQVGSPHFSGRLESGDLLSMTAQNARPQGEEVIFAEDMNARLHLRGGGVITLSSANAALHEARDEADLTGGVHIENALGYVLDTTGMTAALDRVDMISHGPVTGTGPLGDLEAGRMHIFTDPEDADQVQMLFTAGVKMLYLPQTTRKPSP